MLLSVIGLNHKTAPVEVRERLAFSKTTAQTALSQIIDSYALTEAGLLTTCNRVEIYSVSAPGSLQKSRHIEDFFAEFFALPKYLYDSSLYYHERENAARHLFRVASSLDSMVIGEPQILGQVKEWFMLCLQHNATGIVLNEMFKRALMVGKRVRSETIIGHGAVSVPKAAVELARKIFCHLKGKKVTLLGTGKMSELTAKNLHCAGVKNIEIISRSLERATAAAKTLGAAYLVFDSDYKFLNATDILITSTKSHNFLIKKDKLAQLMIIRRHKPLFIIDIAVPRDVEPGAGDLENVYLYNIDDLEQIVRNNRDKRSREIQRAEEIIEKEVAKFCRWLDSLQVMPVLKLFRASFERLRASEMERLTRENSCFYPDQIGTLDYFSRALVNKITNRPTKRLKQIASSGNGHIYAQILCKLFDLESDD